MNWLAPHDAVSAWTHGLWMIAAIPAGAVLVWKNRAYRGKMIGMLIYSITLVLCFGASAVYHAAPEGSLRDVLQHLDYLGIYLLIAGSVTAVAVAVLRGWWRRWLLVQIWVLALTGSVLRLTLTLPPWASTSLYIGMGCVGVVTYFELAKCLSHRGVRSLWMGGLCYIVGAVLEVLRWPDPWPNVIGHHELFHLWVMAGAAFHYYFMLAVVTPSRVTAVPVRKAVDTSPAGDAPRDPTRTRQER
jgi:hemolysin III